MVLLDHKVKPESMDHLVKRVILGHRDHKVTVLPEVKVSGVIPAYLDHKVTLDRRGLRHQDRKETEVLFCYLYAST